MLPLIFFHARRIHRRVFRWVEFDDLVQEGCIGVLQAAERYVEGKARTFGDFANRRIRGAMYDYLRRSIPGGRNHGGEFVLESLATPIFEDVTLGDTLRSTSNPEADAMRSETAQHVRLALDELPRRTQYILRKVHGQEERQSDVARELNICQGRVSQIRTRAFEKLRVRLAL